ncbi:uncharacterized protein LOC114746083 [Neltuma alba]|uniref:uncharacterized protein LOC114746083 n=1 Tax=Neltuma alba TaxID=207710 RepID=UPI0010A38F49|nr:uncharacterized protein LOC114746083 [Prosopis alba]
MEALNEKESGDEGTVSSVSENTDSDNFEDSRSTGEEEEAEEEEDIPASMNEEGEKESDANTKTNSEFYDGGVKNEEEVAERSVLMEGSSEVHENSMRRVEEKTESSVTMEDDFDHENSKKRGGGGGGGEDRDETRKSALMEGEEMERDEEDEETERPALITNKFEYVSGRGIIGFVEEPTTAMTFSFREFFVGPYVSDTEISELKSEKKKSAGAQSFGEFHPSPGGSQVEISDLKSKHEPVFQEEAEREISELKSEDEKSTGEQSFQEESQRESAQEQSFPSVHASPNVSEAGISETKSEDDHVLEEEEEEEGSIQEQRMFHGHSSSDQFSLKSDVFRGRDSSDEDDLDFYDNSFESDSESESSSSSGLIWGNSDKTDDLITYDFLAYQKGLGELEPETLKLMQKLRAIDEFIELAPGKAENEDEKEVSKDEGKKWGELDSEEDDDQDDFEWDDDELVQQMKLEMRNARQGGLPTILEDEEEDGGQEVSESPKMAQDLKPLRIEEKLEFKDHIREIQKVHKTYEEKMRKLDILNYQTMHALGLRQLKDPSAKPMILKNLLWSRQDQKKKKKSSEAVVSLVEELEVVYVGQVCLSWEVLCWEYKKAIELKQYDSESVRRYNVVAGEFQLFQVLMQRFIENEPFQGPRIHNYVRNRCVIRNLLQVPPIQDDSMKDKNMMTKDEEDTVSSEKLAEIIRESITSSASLPEPTSTRLMPTPSLKFLTKPNQLISKTLPLIIFSQTFKPTCTRRRRG